MTRPNADDREAVTAGTRRRSLSKLFTWRSALAESDLPPVARHVGMTLSLHMSERGDSCFPSLELLAKETGRGKTTVVKALRTLEASGYLRVDRGGGRGRSNRYTATVPKGSGSGLFAPTPNGSSSGLFGAETVLRGAENGSLSGPEVVKECVALPIGSARDEVYDALLACFRNPDALSDREKRQTALAANEIRKLGGTATEVRAAIRAYRRDPTFGDCLLTPKAIQTNWGKLTPAPRREEGAVPNGAPCTHGSCRGLSECRYE